MTVFLDQYLKKIHARIWEDSQSVECLTIELAAAIKCRWPDTRILFLTGYSQYAVEGEKKRLSGRIVAKTFGNFDFYMDGQS